jgi:hypothetical protein
MIAQVTAIDDLKTEATVCDKCGYVTLTKEQAIAYAALKHMHEAVDSTRKIIRIGNSLGITLPERLGTKAGDKVKLSALSEKSFKVELT